MNLALMQQGYPVTINPPILRGDYIEAIQKANVGDHQPFRNFISCMVWESQREYLPPLASLGVE